MPFLKSGWAARQRGSSVTSPAHAARHGGSGMKTRHRWPGHGRGRAPGTPLHGGVDGKRVLTPAFSPRKPGNSWEHFPRLGSLLRGWNTHLPHGLGSRVPPAPSAADADGGSEVPQQRSVDPSAGGESCAACPAERCACSERLWAARCCSTETPEVGDGAWSSQGAKRPCVWDLHRGRCMGTPAPAGGP